MGRGRPAHPLLRLVSVVLESAHVRAVAGEQEGNPLEREFGGKPSLSASRTTRLVG